MFEMDAFEGMEDLVDEEPTVDVIAQFGGLRITSVQQLVEPGLPRKELLVRALEQVQDQKATIFRLKHELDEAENALCSLFWVHNSLQLIRLIPDEVLGHIFLLSRTDDIDDEDLYFAVRPPLRLSHVCRHWREVAIATPALWSHVPLDNVSVAASFLPRSKSVPVDVVIAAASEGKKTKHMAKLLLEHVSHTRSILIATKKSSPALLRFLDAVKSFTAPMLEYLYIRLTAETDDARGQVAPASFFGNEPPPLRRLDISHIPAPWTGSLLAGGQLTHIRVLRQSMPSLLDLLSLLRTTPHLVELDLRYLTAPDFLHRLGSIMLKSRAIKVSKRAALPKLRRLILINVDVNHEELFAHLDAPALTDVAITHVFSTSNIGLDEERPELGQPHGLDNILTAPLRNLSHLPIFSGAGVDEIAYRSEWRLCSLTYRHSPDLGLAGTIDSSEAGNHTAARQCKTIEILLEPHSEWGPMVFGSLGSASGIPLPNLRSLYLFGIPEYAEEGYRVVGFEQPTYDSVFGHLPSLRELTVERCAVAPIIHALAGVQSSYDSDGRFRVEVDGAAFHTVRCPRLSLFSVSVDQTWHDSYQRQAFIVSTETSALLRAFVLARVGQTSAEVANANADVDEEDRDGAGLKVFKLSVRTRPGANQVQVVVPIFAPDTVERLEVLSDDFARVGGQLERDEGYAGGGTVGGVVPETWAWTF